MDAKLRFLLLATFLVVWFEPNVGQSSTPSPSNSSSGLFLTPLIESRSFDQARSLAQVNNLFGNETQTVPSYSGFLTVNKQYNSNLFFWFFPSASKEANPPLLLWLNGGPGYSSLYGMFNENGPYVVNKNGSVSLRNTTWNEQYAVLYIDQPVGAGFSFTDNDKGYARSLTASSKDLYEALKQFYTLFSEYQNSDFYITGESYAGKYIPGLAHQIHKHAQESKSLGINLKGIAICNGLVDPRNQMLYGDHLYNVGMIDRNQKHYFEKQEDKIKYFIDHRRYLEAYKIWDRLMLGELTNGAGSTFTNVTGFNFRYNILQDTAPEDLKYYQQFVTANSTRTAIHAGNGPFYSDSFTVETYLFSDFMISAAPYLEELLDANYRVLLYSGSLDIIVPTVSSEKMLRKLKWRGAKRYREAPRRIFRTPGDPQITGYVKEESNLVFVTVRNAGHIVPYERPDVALDLLNRFVNNAAF